MTLLKRGLLSFFGWMLFFSLVVAFVYSGMEGGPGHLLWSAPFLVFVLFYLLAFYLHHFLLWPRLYLEKQYAAYAGFCLLLLGLAFFLQPFDQLHHGGRPPGEPAPFDGSGGPGPRPLPLDIVSIVLLVMVLAVSGALQLLKQWRLTERRALEAEAARSQAELSFLRAQINPHFLFNTLNNIYSLVVTGSETAPKAILQLSHIMRFVTDEGSQARVPLRSEVACIADYIALQSIRLSSKTTVDFRQELGDAQEEPVPPLLLMTFVENAFKYGVSTRHEGTIRIRLEAAEGLLQFSCTNTVYPQAAEKERQGIGIANARQRLEQLYPGRHELNIRQEGDTFHVALRLAP